MQNNMLAQVESLPALIRDEFDRLDTNVRSALDHNQILSTKRLLITGCGDSYMAGLAAEMAFTSLAGVRTEPIKAMQAARYHQVDQPSDIPNNFRMTGIPDFPFNPLTIAISVSGTVSRTAEAARMAKEKGALTVGITANPDAPLGQSVDHIIDCTLPPFPESPGVRSYRISLLVLYLMAIHMAEVYGKIGQEEGNQFRKELRSLADVMEKTIDTISQPVQALAKEFKDQKNFVFVGHGPNYGTALFGAAKVIEAAGLHAVGQDTEEWAHLEYWINVETATPTFIISPDGRGHSRAAEIMEPMKRIGRKIIAVVPEGDTAVASSASHVFPVIGKVREMFSPMVYALASEMFSAYLYKEVGAEPFRASRPVYESGTNTIRVSKIMKASEL
jgi:glutamine---fructose-6-phosphate transaminase (isomerizing)